MKVPISWLKDFVDIDIPILDLAHQMTMAGLEVEEIRFVGLPIPKEGSWDTSLTGIEWDREKLVLASILEVLPHPNADRLVLCKLFDGQQEHVVLTGASNLFEFKGKGPLQKPLKVAYAREGAQIYDGHQPGQVLTTLKRAKIRGVESFSMACSEKELGISDEHEGIIIFDDDAPVGAALADYIGDAVMEVSILPSFARCANILGVAREIAALTGKLLRTPKFEIKTAGEPFKAEIEITNPELNPRFVLGLIRDISIRPSPYKVQLRLKLAGMRPINNIVDATNYAMLEVGEPLHAFDYDVFVGRASSPTSKVKIITRTAKPGEKLTTLDGIERTLDETTVLVCDRAGPLSIAGIMGGAESEVSEGTNNILLEGAAWNFINIRKTAKAQNLPSEASYRFSRGVHPAMAERGVQRGLELMQQWSGGVVAQGLVDVYPLPPKDPTVEITPADVQRWLGIDLSIEEIRRLLEALEFHCSLKTDDCLLVTTPDHRLDIGEGVTGKADVIEEIARVYGYDHIPETRMADQLPPQIGNPLLDKEEKVRDLLVVQGLQEIISYRFTTPEREARRLPASDEAEPRPEPDGRPYVRLANPISTDKTVMRHSVLASLLETAEHNARIRERLALFEIGPIFLSSEQGDPSTPFVPRTTAARRCETAGSGQGLPDELQRLAVLLAGPRSLPTWQGVDNARMDFYDLKGLLAGLLENLHIPNLHYEPSKNPTFHPGKCARSLSGEKQLGVFGELHPQVRERYDWPAAYSATPILAADMDMDAILALVPVLFETAPVPEFPPVLEDLALVVDESLPAERVAELIRQTGGKVVADVRLFDVYRGEKIGSGKKSLAYSLTYQVADKTLSDKDVAGIRTRILRRLEQEVGAKLR